MGSTYELDPEELSLLVKNRDDGSADTIVDKYGGVKGIVEKLRSNEKTGLTNEEIESRRAHFGENLFPEKPPRPWIAFWWDAIQDKTLIILIIAAVISIILGVAVPPKGEEKTGWIEGTAILIAIAIVSGVASTNDWSKDKKFRQLSQAFDSTKKIKVLRNGEAKELNLPEIVVGDIINLQSGDDIPADMLLIKSEGLSVNESSMTGEPEAREKGEEDFFLLSNTLVSSGIGKGIVIAVGPNSQWGKIKATLEKGEVETPLQVKLGDMAENIGKLGVVAATLTLIALILKWTIQDYGVDHVTWEWNHLKKLVDFIIIAITIIVVAVPEGLPLAVTLALAYSMVKMMRDRNLVRHLAACETMGGATQICSDKTGTLTENKMTAIKLRIAKTELDDFVNNHDVSKISAEVIKSFNEGIAVNSESNIVMEGNQEKFSGLATECALLVMSRTLGTNYQTVRDNAVKVKSWPFSSKKKRMSTIVRHDDTLRLYCKGASEVVLELCDTYIDEKGNKQDIQPIINDLRKQIEDWAALGLRTLSLTYKDLPLDTPMPKEEPKKKKEKGEKKEEKKEEDDGCPFEENLTLIAIVGIEDPIRREVPESVRICQRAGITVRMLTGDNILTAKKIARTAGILTDDGVAMEGPKFRALSKAQIDELVPNLQVIARCSPEDKLILVTRLRELGEVVAVTGDGTNDAPILREADVGFAMGISGTAVAKDASDIVLMDDNFSSIEKAVLWGRNVYDSIRKFLQFQLTVNIVAVLIAFLGAVTTGESPLKAIQLLWVNLIMDTMAALALATETPTPELMDRPPHGRYSALITNQMWKGIIGQAFFQLFVLLFTLYGAQTVYHLDVRGQPATENRSSDDYLEDETRSTIVFNTFVFCQLFNEINARVLSDDFNVFRGIHKNPIFGAVLVVSIIIQALLIEFGFAFAHTTSLDALQWLFCILVSSLSLPLAVFIKLIPVPADKPGKVPPPKDAITIELESKEPKSAQENWKLARDALLAQRKPGIVELVRKTHNRGNVQFGKSRITKNYTFMEY
eukprot:TRINITY_DN832_c0_g1_i2.p1 TRINITY_DN832_c0_g1~~TRINITY_DN832_c0_g1_i2.p1  ORF type:complete len:1035 (-),score=320.40 TRINITY_DN832_c0_g1_i2:105-3209(-)